MSNNNSDNLFKDNVIGHPAGLFVLFFTEMWERFSFYGMRSLLVLFFMTPILKNGWGWDQSTASSLFGTYVGLVLSFHDVGWLLCGQNHRLSLGRCGRSDSYDFGPFFNGIRISIFHLFGSNTHGIWQRFF